MEIIPSRRSPVPICRTDGTCLMLSRLITSLYYKLIDFGVYNQIDLVPFQKAPSSHYSSSQISITLLEFCHPPNTRLSRLNFLIGLAVGLACLVDRRGFDCSGRKSAEDARS